MKRREFIALAGGLATYQSLQAQQPAFKRIGYLTPAFGPNAVDEVFDRTLQSLGWVKDRDLKIEFRSAQGRRDTAAPIVAEILGLGLDLVAVRGRQMALLLGRTGPLRASIPV